jgi:hypothetical protein
MTKEEFLLDTIEYYAEDTNRRGEVDGNCRLRINDKRCAIGRYIADEVYAEEGETLEGCTIIQLIDKKVLSEEIIGLDEEFLNRVQIFHDDSHYWEEDKGLTKIGKIALSKLLITWDIKITNFIKYIND